VNSCDPDVMTLVKLFHSLIYNTYVGNTGKNSKEMASDKNLHGRTQSFLD